jgi:hypothetical protein
MALRKTVAKIYGGATHYHGGKFVTSTLALTKNEQVWQVQHTDGDVSDYNATELELYVGFWSSDLSNVCGDVCSKQTPQRSLGN